MRRIGGGAEAPEIIRYLYAVRRWTCHQKARLREIVATGMPVRRAVNLYHAELVAEFRARCVRNAHTFRAGRCLGCGRPELRAVKKRSGVQR